MNKYFRSMFLSAMLITLIFGTLCPATAAGLGATPTQFNIHIQPSQTFSGTITVNNPGNNPVFVELDKKRELSDGLHLLFDDTGVASWITVTPNNFTLNPGESKVVNFHVTAPSNINYNDALGVILIKGTPITQSDNPLVQQLELKHGIELGIPLSIGLPGPIIESLQFINQTTPSILLSFMHGDLQYVVHNNGTVKEDMAVNTQINGWFQNYNLTLKGGTVYPGDDHYILGSWEPGITDIGFYHVITTISYGQLQNKTINAESDIFVFPIWLLVLIILLIVYLILKRRKLMPKIRINVEREKK